MALDATPGGANSNSYTTLADATLYLQQRPYHEAWDAALVSGDAAPALMWATSLLDSLVHWYGTPTTLTQALAWPQTGQVDRYGRPLDPLLIPVAVEQATAVYALALLGDTTLSQPNGGSQQAGIKSTRIGGTTITYQDTTNAVAATSPVTSVPSEVRALLKGYGVMAGMIAIPILRT
jgi:hypothetical protein